MVVELKRKRKSIEHIDQVKVVQHFRAFYPDIIIAAIPNGGDRTASERVRLHSLSLWTSAKRGELLARARTRGGRSLAEQTLEIADAASPQEAQVAKLRVDTRRWLASKQAPDEYGDKQQPLVNIDLGSMALDALRKRSIVSIDDSEEVNTK
jgi:hypothetical protein